VRAYVEGIWRFRTDRATGWTRCVGTSSSTLRSFSRDTYAIQAAILRGGAVGATEAILPGTRWLPNAARAARDRPTQISEMTYVRRADASGSFRELYGR